MRRILCGACKTALVACVGVIACALTAAVFRCAVNEVCFVNDDFGGVSLLVVLVGPASYLDVADDADARALVEIAGNEFRGLSSSDTIDEIGLLLGTFCNSSVYCHRE